MKRLPSIIILLAGAAAALVVEVDPTEVTLRTVDGWTVVELDGGVVAVSEGAPALPSRPLHYSAPPGACAADVKILSVETLPLELEAPVIPALYLTGDEDYHPPEADPALYASMSPVPDRPLVAAGGGNAAGESLAALILTPFIYRPGTGELELVTRVEFEIVHEPSACSPRLPRVRTPRAAELHDVRLEALIDNPPGSTAATAHARQSTTAGPLIEPLADDETAEWLLITADAFTDDLQPLVDWRTEQGWTTAVVTVDYIEAEYSGRDTQERIRNCIIDFYENHSTVHVVLGADTNNLPERRGFAFESGAPDEYLIPADLYYADLDGDWNADGDDRWGETADDDVDLYSDVVVTRLPLFAPGDGARIIDKILTYEQSPPEGFTENVLLLGSDWDAQTPGDVFCDYIDDDLPAELKPATKLYQSLGNLSRATTIPELEAGNCAVIAHCGHGNYSLLSLAAELLYVNDLLTLENGFAGGWYAAPGCLCGGFDRPRCLGEAWLFSEDGGGVAAIMNSRVSWYMPNLPGNGPGERLIRTFVEKVFVDELREFGASMTAMRDFYVPYALSNPTYCWSLYDMNVLGPSLTPSWGREPLELNVYHPDSYTGGSLTVTVSDGDGPLEGALVGLHKAGEVHAAARTNAAGAAFFSDLEPQTAGSITLTVTAVDHLPHQAGIYVPNADIDGVSFEGASDEDGARLAWTIVAPAAFTALSLFRDGVRLNDEPLPVGDGAWLDRGLAGTAAYRLELFDAAGRLHVVGPLELTAPTTIARTALHQPHPCPADDAVALAFETAEAGTVELALYDLAGRRVRLLQRAPLAAGRHELVWDCSGVPEGVYLVRLSTEADSRTTRLVIAR